MSFRKPKNPLLHPKGEPAHEAYQIHLIEAQMRGEPFVSQCGCSFTGYGRDRTMVRCSRHPIDTEFGPSPPVEEPKPES